MIKYIEVPEKKLVIAILEGTEYSAVDQIYKALRSSHLMTLIDIGRYRMSNSFRAVAKCHPDDIYDPEVGKRVAREKLLKKYYEQVDKKCNLFQKDFENVYIKTQRTINKACKVKTI